jgi:hypothetical protein
MTHRWPLSQPALPSSLAPKRPTPPIVEIATKYFCLRCRKDVHRLHWHRHLSPPGESLSTWIDRWDYEARILEVHGVLLAAPHSTP